MIRLQIQTTANQNPKHKIWNKTRDKELTKTEILVRE